MLPFRKVHTSDQRLKNNHNSRSGGVCYLCGARAGIIERLLCRECAADLPGNDGACPVCAMPGHDGLICAGCVKSPPALIQKIACTYRYVYPVRQMIQNMKFNSRLDIINFFGHRMAGHVLLQHIALPECLIPVPLHPVRLKGRGFNQSLELARAVSADTGVPLDHGACKRIQNTAAQTGLTAGQRRRNITGTFEINRKQLPCRHVAIIDDVVTTGSTVRELARCLSKAGVERIDVWACARAAFDQSLP
jgi:ComF family protein